MTHRGRNNVTISMSDGGSVPIVSQTEIDPMKTALSLRALRHRAQCRAAPRREAAGPGRLEPARPTSRAAHSAGRRRVLRTPSRSRATARVRGDGLRRARTACEMDARDPRLRARFVFSVEGPSPCRAGSRRAVLNLGAPEPGDGQEGAWPRKRLEAMRWGSTARPAGIRDELRNCSGRCRTFRAWAIFSRITRPAIGKGVGRPAAGSIQNN